jgi:hypothetical protein
MKNSIEIRNCTYLLFLIRIKYTLLRVLIRINKLNNLFVKRKSK